MATIFTRIIDGEIPGRFLWRDEQCVAFLTIAPLSTGHALVVPIQEVDHWVDLDADLARHCFGVAQQIGRAQMRAFSPTRVGMIIAGLEVPHAHLHVVPMATEADLDFSRADGDPDPSIADTAAVAIRDALEAMGRSEVSER